MAYEKGGGEENKNWNNARIYSLDKIMKPLTFYDKYVRIARFGVENFEDGFGLSEELKNTARFEALQRMVKELDVVCRNAHALVKKGDKENILKFLEVLDAISKKFSLCANYVTNQRDNTQKLKLNEKPFNIISEIVEDLHMKLIAPLNRAELIMATDDEELDIKDIREIQDEIFAVE